MAAFNEEEHISEAIDSILNQTYDDFELIIVDDASDDATTEIVDSYEDERIQLLENQSNKGLPASLNLGIKASKGTYIARMDADDRSLPSRLESQVNLLDHRSDIQVVGSWTRVIDESGSVIGPVEYEEMEYTPNMIKNEGPGIAHPSVMTRKRALQRVGGYREKFVYAQDLDLWVRMARIFSDDFIKIIPEILFERRVTPEMYEKKLLKQEFGNYAGEPPSEIPNYEKISSNTPSLSKATQYHLYHYKMGRWSLQAGKRLKSFSHIRRSILYQPLALCPWYGLFLLLLPDLARKYIANYIKSYFF